MQKIFLKDMRVLMKKLVKCRHCRAKATPCNYHGSEMKEPYLYRCTKKDCGTFFWHRNVLQEFNLKDPKSDQNKKIEENLVKKFKIPKEWLSSCCICNKALKKIRRNKRFSLYWRDRTSSIEKILTAHQRL
jgi:hypothetical protein